MAAPEPDDPRDHDRTSMAIRGALTGNPESLDWVLRKYTPMLMASARQRIGSRLRQHLDADDLVQEVWAITLPRLADLESRQGQMTPVLLRFLAGVMWRCHANMLKRHMKGAPRQRLSESQLPASATGAIQHAIRDEEAARLLAALDELGPEDRKTVILRGIEQLPNHEAALLLDEPANTVAQRYGRALEKLRALVPDTVLDQIRDH